MYGAYQKVGACGGCGGSPPRITNKYVNNACVLCHFALTARALLWQGQEGRR